MARLLALLLAIFAVSCSAFQAPVSGLTHSRVAASSVQMFGGSKSSTPAKKVAKKPVKKVVKKPVKKVVKKGGPVANKLTRTVSKGLNGKSTTDNILGGFGEAFNLLKALNDK